ncbi:hypothetical protein EW146_g862 [Bondarzewia mesenterica]|uniref:RING-type domain-containing protein n=1 Tax=Bondarzewia mesenterica TaxID=1095465 RepID=A0A4S4M5M3_9AGAM|nr:hypothetical protein EW146_g862 [Bondarzewia mesenterica]
MNTRGAATPQSTPSAPKRPSKTASTHSINHLLNFTLPPRQTQQIQSLPRRSRRHGTQQGVWNKERFVNAQYRFVMNPNGDYTVHFADPDIFFQWQDIEQIIIPRNSALASAAGGREAALQDEGHTMCPICLSPPIAPRMTKCGHVFCFHCILHYFNTSEKSNWVRCPLCFDSVNEKQLKSVQWFDGPSQIGDDADEDHPEASSSSSVGTNADAVPQPGSTLRMRLMQRPQITTLALPRSHTWPSDLLPPHQAPFHFLPDVYTYSKFMLATPAYLLECLTKDLDDLTTERRMLLSMGDILGVVFVDAAEQELRNQISKAIALDTDQLRNTIDKALQTQHDIEERVLYHNQRSKQEREAAYQEPSEVPKAYLATRSSVFNTSSSVPTTPSSTPTSRTAKQRRNINPPPPSTSTYYFYQAASGMPIFLHPLDIKVLNAHFNGYASFPDTITVRVEAYNEGSVNDDLRKRCKYLAHMPEGADVVFIEADLTGVVGAGGLRNFEGALKTRRARREGKGKKDDRARARAEEREREKLASIAWRETGTHLYPSHSDSVQADSLAVEDVQDSEPGPEHVPVSGAWGSRSFASALHSGPVRSAAGQRAVRREDEQDEWDLDFAWHELEQRGGNGGGGNGEGGRRKKNRLVVLGGGPGRRR